MSLNKSWIDTSLMKIFCKGKINVYYQKRLILLNCQTYLIPVFVKCVRVNLFYKKKLLNASFEIDVAKFSGHQNYSIC